MHNLREVTRGIYVQPRLASNNFEVECKDVIRFAMPHQPIRGKLPPPHRLYSPPPWEELLPNLLLMERQLLLNRLLMKRQLLLNRLLM